MLMISCDYILRVVTVEKALSLGICEYVIDSNIISDISHTCSASWPCFVLPFALAYLKERKNTLLLVGEGNQEWCLVAFTKSNPPLS